MLSAGVVMAEAGHIDRTTIDIGVVICKICIAIDIDGLVAGITIAGAVVHVDRTAILAGGAVVCEICSAIDIDGLVAGATISGVVAHKDRTAAVVGVVTCESSIAVNSYILRT